MPGANPQKNRAACPSLLPRACVLEYRKGRPCRPKARDIAISRFDHALAAMFPADAGETHDCRGNLAIRVVVDAAAGAHLR
jgi:hypothetical protein